MPTSSAWLLAVAVASLAGCSKGPPDPVAAAPDADRIECAIAGGAGFGRDCSVERIADDRGLILVVHNRDGGFRRLLVTGDGRGVIAADGSEPAHVTVIAGNRIEVAIGADRYRLPATIKGGAAPAR